MAVPLPSLFPGSVGEGVAAAGILAFSTGGDLSCHFGVEDLPQLPSPWTGVFLMGTQ